RMGRRPGAAWDGALSRRRHRRRARHVARLPRRTAGDRARVGVSRDAGANSGVKRIVVAALALTAACGISRGDREQRGDVEWHAGRYAEAAADYKGAGDAARVIAKQADALLLAGDLAASAAAWTQLGTEAPDRAAEAAAGLSRVAVIAQRDG